MTALLRPSIVMLAVLTLLTGAIYPLVVTAVAQIAFPHAANGSLIEQDGKVLGSELIGQPLSDQRHFWSRPSATAPFAYNSASSAGSNLGPTHRVLIDAVKQRVAALHASDPGNTSPIPVDLVTASASGLDPHISAAAAEWQAGRVARVRGLSRAQVDALVASATEGRLFGLLGEPRVNVLKLNLALDGR